MKTRYWIIEVIVFLLAALFFYTAVDKLLDYDEFKWQINNQPFDNSLTPILAAALPAAELLLAFLLLWRKSSLTGLYGSAAVLSISTIYTAGITFNFYKQVPCSCATAFESLSWPVHLLINASFLALALAGIFLSNQQENNDTF